MYYVLHVHRVMKVIVIYHVCATEEALVVQHSNTHTFSLWQYIVDQ